MSTMISSSQISSTPWATRTTAIRVLLVTSEGCKPCSRVKRVLGELQHEIGDLAVQAVEFSSLDGSRLATENGILYPPAVFIEGKLFAKGKIDTDQMATAIRNMNGGAR